MKLQIIAALLLTADMAAANASYTTLTLPSLNADIRTWTDGSSYNGLFPGTQTFNGVPFQLAVDGDGNTAFHNSQIDIPVNIFGVTQAFTLINTAFGADGANVGYVSFSGSLGDVYTVDLIEGQNVRDHYDGAFTNAINGVDAIPAFSAGSGRARLDQQIFNLPAAFANQTLLSIRFHSNQQGLAGEPFIAAATVAAVPLPSAVWLFGTVLAGGIGWAKRRG
ncbi:hypothetical protein PL263_08055 [Methylomonas sp. EFPC3]|uniref:hypothetical protein n=1 Tax=Methylomonas sp. EFPC3 TaxID=3021710 RepID=UPI0024163C08|nr:hypothetical protein [Methylomonas sp. EFPC3]WFP51975.1 hypothetical protein PL263_08055 [Methylomonas sp. EFPC3]